MLPTKATGRRQNGLSKSV